MSGVQLVLLIIALVFLGMAAFGAPARRVSWGWLGLFVWLLATLVPALLAPFK